MITYSDLDKQELFRLKFLWLKNSRYHSDKSEYFNDSFDASMFQKRVYSWNRAASLIITVAQKDENIIAFCISSIYEEYGNIESLFVRSDFRKQGIGKRLVLKHIDWFHKNNCQRIEVSTVYHNQEAIEFYKSVGMFPKTITMRLK